MRKDECYGFSQVIPGFMGITYQAHHNQGTGMIACFIYDGWPGIAGLHNFCYGLAPGLVRNSQRCIEKFIGVF